MIGAAKKAELAVRDARIVAAYANGELQDPIAKREGISCSMVSTVLKKYGARLPAEASRARMIDAGQHPSVRRKAAESNRRPLLDRFLEKFTKGTDPDSCWLWHGSTGGNGYPQITHGGKNIHASHAALLLHGRPRAAGLYALHTCDNPLCVNPDHLWWGTQKENAQDALAKGRLDLSGLALAPQVLRARERRMSFAAPEKHGRVEIEVGHG